MSLSRLRPTVISVAETLLIGVAGGAILGGLGVPAGWLIGAMLAVAAAALGGRPMLIPRPLANVIAVFVGISLGAVVTPETLRGISTWPLSLALSLVSVVCISAAGTAYLRFVHGWGVTAAMLGSAPGALSQVMLMANELGVDLRPVAVVQTIRVLAISMGLPLALAMFGLISPGGPTLGGAFNPDMLGELATLVASSAVAAYLFQRLRLPGGLMFGAMVSSGVLHGAGFVHAVLPWWVANAAMLTLGCITGSRFTNTSLRVLVNLLAAGVGLLAVSILIAGVFMAVLALPTSLQVADVSLAYAPGAVEVMMMLALALNVDPIFVGVHHLSRIIFISTVIPFVSRWSVRFARLPPEPEPPPQKQVPFED